jgi:hypothetical protein
MYFDAGNSNLPSIHVEIPLAGWEPMKIEFSEKLSRIRSLMQEARISLFSC